jgi:hypothetical protein
MPYYTRIDAPASPEQKAKLLKLKIGADHFERIAPRFMAAEHRCSYLERAFDHTQLPL